VKTPFDSDLRLHVKPFIYRGFLRVLGQSYTGIFTGLAARSETGLCSDTARPLLAYPMHFRGEDKTKTGGGQAAAGF
jgi:hypothetical protein